jgi:hypothetical protein
MKLEFIFKRPTGIRGMPEVKPCSVLGRLPDCSGSKEAAGSGMRGLHGPLRRAGHKCLSGCVGKVRAPVLTIEDWPRRKLHPIQEAFVDLAAIQCGFCTPGMVMAAYGLLKENPSPSRQEVVEGLAGNLCRCTGYHDIIRAVQKAAKQMRKG